MRPLWTLLIILLLSACGPDTNQSADWNKEAVITEVKQMFDDYHRDIMTNGLTAEFKYLDQSVDFFWVPPGYQSALSYDSVKTILASSAGAYSKIEFYWETLQVFPLSAGIANYTGIVSGTMKDTAGVTTPVQIIESGTVIKRKDGWKLLSGQSAALTK